MHFGDYGVQVDPQVPSCHHPSFRRSITIVGRGFALMGVVLDSRLAAALTQEAGTARRHVGSSLPETPCTSLTGSGKEKMHERRRVALHGWCDWNT